MTLTLAVYSGIALLLAWALWRRPQVITVALALSFVLAVLAARSGRGDALRSILMGLDGFTVIVMWSLWKWYRSDRAAQVAVLGMVKICFGIASAVAGVSDLVWASGNNALFVGQVLIAGGFVNGFMAWLGRRLDGARGGRRGLLGHLERLP